jgi:hypothetical protein
MTLFYNDGYSGLNFNSFKELGYDLSLIDNKNYQYINELKDNDVLFVKLDDIDKINQFVNTNLKLTIFLFISHEYCNEHRRIDIIKYRNPNHLIWFLTSHIDFYSKDNDMSLEARMFPFNEAFSDKVNINPPHRTTKYNFFNRSINLRRLKIFEILKKKNIQLLDCYFTFGNIIKHNTFGEINTIAEFVKFRDNENKLEIDVDFISKYKDEFKLYENRQDVELGIIQASHSNDMYDTINEQSLDSFVSMIVESSGDKGDDYRLTEKTLRACLCKNIFLTLQCKGFTKLLKQNGIETFEDVFGLDENWDDCEELERINKFILALEYINRLSIAKVARIYNRKHIQDRIEKNYNFINHSFDSKNILTEIQNKISYGKDNVH